MSKEISLFKKNVSSNFSFEHIQKKAVETGFYKRSSKFLPDKFFEIMLFSASINGPCSLSQASNEVAECFGISISKQGLDEKYTDKAVDFIRSIFEDLLTKQIDGTLNSGYLKKFSRVRIKDSTRFDLPDRLKEHFRGYGGRITSEAATSIQYEFDIKNGKMIDINFTSGRRTDYQDASETVSDIEKGDLVIRDLGYFKTDVLKKIKEREAYFISRLNTQILVFGENSQEISFSDLYHDMTRKKMSHLEMQVKIGEKEKLPVRLVIDVVPEEVYQKRIIKAEKEAKKNGCQVRNGYKARLHFNLMITNILEVDLSSSQVYLLYKIRWQIELMFKIWKSTIGINKIHTMGYNRLMCLFYAKLILILLNHQIINLIQPVFYKRFGKLLSKDKCFKTLWNYFYKIRKLLFQANQKTGEFIKKMTILLSKNHWLEKRNKRMNYGEIFNLFIS